MTVERVVAWHRRMARDAERLRQCQIAGSKYEHELTMRSRLHADAADMIESGEYLSGPDLRIVG